MTPFRKSRVFAAAIMVTAIMLMLLVGCTPLRPADGRGEPVARGDGSGVYHIVARGETLWRISKTYGV